MAPAKSKVADFAVPGSPGGARRPTLFALHDMHTFSATGGLRLDQLITGSRPRCRDETSQMRRSVLEIERNACQVRTGHIFMSEHLSFWSFASAKQERSLSQKVQYLWLSLLRASGRTLGGRLVRRSAGSILARLRWFRLLSRIWS